MTIKRLGKGERLPGGFHRLPKNGGKRDVTDNPDWYTHAGPVKVTKADGTVTVEKAKSRQEMYDMLEKGSKKPRHRKGSKAQGA